MYLPSVVDLRSRDGDWTSKDGADNPIDGSLVSTSPDKSALGVSTPNLALSPGTPIPMV